MKDNFWDTNNKIKSSTLRNLFYQNIIIMFWLTYESFSILSDVFVKKVPFPAKTAETKRWANIGKVDTTR